MHHECGAFTLFYVIYLVLIKWFEKAYLLLACPLEHFLKNVIIISIIITKPPKYVIFSIMSVFSVRLYVLIY